MGIRAKILLFVGVLVLVALAQMGASWWMSSSMGSKLSRGAGQAVDAMGESIRRNESARVGTTLLANSADLETMVAEVERATLMTADFGYAAIAFARSSAENRALAEEEIERFFTVTLKERMPEVSGIGITFELHGFVPDGKRHYFPYAYREDGQVVFSDEVVVPEGVDPATLTDADRDAIVANEMQAGYYAEAVPVGHNRSQTLPQKVSWTVPYIDPTTHYLMLSAVTPLSYDSRVVGVALLDVALTDLDALASRIGSTLTPGAKAMIFDYTDRRVLSAPAMPEWKAELVDNVPEPRALSGSPLGRRVNEMASSLQASQVAHAEWREGGDEYTLFTGNVHDLFGIAVLVPDAELFADTRAAQAAAGDLQVQQAAEMSRIRLIGAASLAVMLLVGALVALFVFRLTNNLATIVRQLNQDAGGVSHAFQAINDLSTGLADDTARQAAALEATSSSLNDISAKVKANAEAAETCNQTMLAASSHVNAGERQMSHMSEAMNSIAESSEKIGAIIKTIESISFQTNLLALNAAVEASRETAALIEETTARVGAGTKSVAELDAGFKDILSGVNEAAAWVDRIRESTNEQAEAIASINSSVANLDTAVKRNEEAAGESAATSAELADQAASLADTAERLNHLSNGSRSRPGQVRQGGTSGLFAAGGAVLAAAAAGAAAVALGDPAQPAREPEHRTQHDNGDNNRLKHHSTSLHDN